jgi:hypothetical protein
MLGEVDVTLDEMLDGKFDKKRREQQKPVSKRDDAKGFIADALTNGSIPAAEIKALADGAGISKNTLERAKSELGVQSVQRDGAWFWAVPECETA